LDSAYTGAELAEMISDSRREGLLDEHESSRLTRTLGSAGRTVADVMVPLERVVTLPVAATVGDVASAVATFGVSRFPVREESGRLVGYLHVKDVLSRRTTRPRRWPASRVRGPAGDSLRRPAGRCAGRAAPARPRIWPGWWRTEAERPSASCRWTTSSSTTSARCGRPPTVE